SLRGTWHQSITSCQHISSSKPRPSHSNASVSKLELYTDPCFLDSESVSDIELNKADNPSILSSILRFFFFVRQDFVSFSSYSLGFSMKLSYKVIWARKGRRSSRAFTRSLHLCSRDRRTNVVGLHCIVQASKLSSPDKRS